MIYIHIVVLEPLMLHAKKVQVGKDQEKAQSEKDSHSKNRGGKKPNQQSGTYTMKHIVSRMSSYFPNRWPLSYLNLTKNMKTYIRRQQHKKCYTPRHKTKRTTTEVSTWSLVEIGPVVPEKKIFEGFLPYMGMAAILVM